ncbi:unnamed protein product [Anisakis simplex]|uniref:Uncharacterized protein n=1 Tax=Anisakis simplex TaxID=6269 RepID=A0A0M3J583_ANISI|nr:unnamed protein product [Anisakis simplex]
MEGKYREWLQLMKCLKNNETEAEVKRYEEFMLALGNFSERIEEVWEPIAVIEVQLDEIRNLLNSNSNETENMTATKTTSPTVPPFDLLKIHPPNFNGDPMTLQSEEVVKSKHVDEAWTMETLQKLLK